MNNAAASLGARRAAISGSFGVAMVVTGLTIFTVCLLRSVQLPYVLLGGTQALMGCASAVRGFRSRVDFDSSGVTGSCNRLLTRPKVAWADIADFECVGSGTDTSRAALTARTREGQHVKLLNFGVDVDAAEQAVITAQNLRSTFDADDLSDGAPA